MTLFGVMESSPINDLPLTQNEVLTMSLHDNRLTPYIISLPQSGRTIYGVNRAYVTNLIIVIDVRHIEWPIHHVVYWLQYVTNVILEDN